MRMKSNILRIFNFIPILPLFLLVSSVIPLTITQRYVSVQPQDSECYAASLALPLLSFSSHCLHLPKSLSITTSSFLRTHTQYPLYLEGC